MLTPQDLQAVGFQKAKIGGYVKAEVDEFLEPLLEDYVTLYKENAVLKSKMRLLVERLEAYRGKEAEMKQALADTQKSCEELVADAERRSARIQGRERVITVVLAVPAPIEVELVAVVVAIANEAVATIAESSINQRPRCVEVGTHHAFPLAVAGVVFQLSMR